MTQTSSAPACPRCTAALPDANARFCSACGAAAGSASCSGCGTALTPGARFCHRCGTAAGAAAPAASTPTARGDAFSNALPWAVAGIALVALIALIAGQRFSGRATDAVPVAQASPSLGANGMRAPDISALSPRERADRLFDRIMLLDEQGKSDSVQFFAQMGISAFQMLPELDAHARYDMGRIAEVAGIASMAQAQADTILSGDSSHLLGLILAGNAARLSGNAAAAREYDQRLVSAAPAERARGLLEYQQHQADIDTALARIARGS